MTVHMFRIMAEKPSDVSETEANKLINEWLNNHTQWANDPTAHEITLVENSLTDVPQYFTGDFRFERESDKQTILSQIETKLTEVTSWYRIGYHQCSHDETEGGSCSWTEVIEYGTVPSEIPTLS